MNGMRFNRGGIQVGMENSGKRCNQRSKQELYEKGVVYYIKDFGFYLELMINF